MSIQDTLNTHSLQGKYALVTGASRGIGAGIALSLGQHGAFVIITYTSQSSESKAEEVLTSIKKAGGNGAIVKADMANLDDIKTLAEKTNELGNGGIDIIVNNAGVSYNKAVSDITLEHYESQYNVNVRGPLFLMHHLLPTIRPGGRVINLSSVSARGGFAQQSVYGATKAALEAMTRTWTNEFAQAKQITVNAINPGPVESDMWNSAVKVLPKAVTESVKQTPSGKRIGNPDDIAQIVVFLASEQSRWVNGNVICGNGGMMML